MTTVYISSIITFVDRKLPGSVLPTCCHWSMVGLQIGFSNTKHLGYRRNRPWTTALPHLHQQFSNWDHLQTTPVFIWLPNLLGQFLPSIIAPTCSRILIVFIMVCRQADAVQHWQVPHHEVYLPTQDYKCAEYHLRSNHLSSMTKYSNHISLAFSTNVSWKKRIEKLIRSQVCIATRMLGLLCRNLRNWSNGIRDGLHRPRQTPCM